MEQKLQIKEVEPIVHKGDIVLQLTDFQLHSNMRSTKSPGKALKRSIELKRPGRIFAPLADVHQESPDTFEFSSAILNDPSLLQMIQEWNRQGRRVLIEVPKTGVPIFFGKDAVDFTKSVRGKRVLRKIAREGGFN